MVGVDPDTGTSAVRFWLATGSAVLFAAAGVLVFAHPQVKALSSVMRSGIAVLAAVLAASIAWAFFDHPVVRDRDADRHALEMRAEELTGRVLAPGSPLACLDAMAGEGVETACEKELFASPATVAAAVAYAGARISLLSDMVAYVKGGGGGIDRTLLPLRRSLEADRYGFFAHVLTVRDGCTSQNCKLLDSLRDSSHLRANLTGAVLDRYVEHYQTVWAQPPDIPVAEATHAAEPTAAAQSSVPAPRKVLVNIDFPTAASIPAVSIMNPEPTGRSPAGATAAAAANPNPPGTAALSPRRPKKQAANPPAQPAMAPSAPPPAAAAQGQEDPIWTPNPAVPSTQAAASAAAPTANFALGTGAPVQLNPFSSPQ